jgi:D-cysteine desulfhydrase
MIPPGLAAQPRIALGTLPTPLHPAPRLSKAAGVEIWFKRDDLTGLGLGGNKVRTLEFVLGAALEADADCLITGGGPSSNWAMLAALAARTRGMDAVLVYYGDPVPLTGNLALADQVGAEIHFTGEADRSSVETVAEAIADRMRAAGRKPYTLGRGGAGPVGALGYLTATGEVVAQAAELNLRPSQLWLATGSCGTHAGLVAGAAVHGVDWEVHGVTVSRPVDECVERVATIAADACKLIGAAPPVDPPIVHPEAMLASGYGEPSAESTAAAQLVARTEGVFLDPVFAAKAMAGLLRAAHTGAARGPVMFLVSGGAPTLFGVSGH